MPVTLGSFSVATSDGSENHMDGGASLRNVFDVSLNIPVFFQPVAAEPRVQGVS